MGRRKNGDDVCLPCVARFMSGFLFESSPQEPEALTGATLSANRDHSFEDYEILLELGRGGMGTVFKARQHGTEAIVALKVIDHGPKRKLQAEARFIAEIESVATLRHPNIVTILDVGTHEDLPFFTMPYIQGGAWRIQGIVRWEGMGTNSAECALL